MRRNLPECGSMDQGQTLRGGGCVTMDCSHDHYCASQGALIFEDVTGQVREGRAGMLPPHLTHLASSLDHGHF